ncbi:MAG TPA: hypothetical protein V6D19_13655 [Stenomitos sp.]
MFRKSIAIGLANLAIGGVLWQQPAQAQSVDSVVGGFLGGLTGSMLGGGNNNNNKESSHNKIKDEQRLIPYGLQPTSCNPGVVLIYVGRDQSICAFPTANYPAGTYRIHPDTLQLLSVGINQSNSSQQPPAVPSQLPTPYYPSTQPMQPWLFPLNAGGASLPTPSIIDNLNPHQYSVSPAIEVQIRNILSSRGISLASCGQSPTAIFMIGRYTACAFPSPNYPAGRYQIETQLPF